MTMYPLYVGILGKSKVGKTTLADLLGQKVEGSYEVIEYSTAVIRVANAWGDSFVCTSPESLMCGLAAAVKKVFGITIEPDDLLQALEDDPRLEGKLKEYLLLPISPTQVRSYAFSRDLHRPILEVIGSLLMQVAPRALDDYVRPMIAEEGDRRKLVGVCIRYPSNVDLVREFPGAVIVRLDRPRESGTFNPTEAHIGLSSPDVVIKNTGSLQDLAHMADMLWKVIQLNRFPKQDGRPIELSPIKVAAQAA